MEKYAMEAFFSTVAFLLFNKTSYALSGVMVRKKL